MKNTCNGVCKQVYKDRFPSRYCSLVIDSVRFNCHTLGLKFCHVCEMFTALEDNFMCACCKVKLRVRRNKAKTKTIRRRTVVGLDEDDVILTIQEKNYYFSIT